MPKYIGGMLFVCLLMLAGCSVMNNDVLQSAPAGLPMSDLANLKGTVTLDIYSGRVNPSWDLSGTTLTDLVAILDQLKTTPSFEGPDPDSRLGYRGFIVELTYKPSGAIRHLVIYQGGIKETGAQVKFYVDPDRKIEKLLLESARSHINTETYSAVESEIPK